MDQSVVSQNSKSGEGLVLIDQLANWLIAQALSDDSIENIFSGCCLRLHAAGVPIARGHLAFNTLHPLFKTVSMTWWPKDGMTVTSGHHDEPADEWMRSPPYYMIQNNLEFLRRRLSGPERSTDFRLLEELADEGYTDYLGYMVEFTTESSDRDDEGDGIVGSWVTDRPAGFSERDIRALNRIQRRLAVACKVQKTALVVRNVLDAYLGPGAGSRVLKGQIKLGDMKSIHAVIWYSDLRDSTAMAERLGGEEFLTALNQYFDCTAGAVIEHGGEVLRFVGDAVLAIFPITADTSERDASKAALAAATSAQRRLAEVNIERGQGEKLRYGLGLHIGDVQFGNIGVPERIEFSVIGPAANEVARLEELTKSLQRSVLVSQDFAKNFDETWEALGRHPLKGVGDLLEVYAPPID